MCHTESETGTTENDLTPREQEIMGLLQEGKSTKEIVTALEISLNTVEFHKTNLYKKLGVQSLQELLVKYLNKEEHKFNLFASFTHWNELRDEKSSIKVKATKEYISIKGLLADHITPFACVWGYPDSPTLNALRTMKSFSFKVKGDGNHFSIQLPTTDTEDDHWLYIFQTVKNKEITVTANIPGDLTRMGYSGKQIEFIQNNIRAFGFQAIDKGPFKLKFWDIKLFQ
jgi:DNA-binding CsgD family transcriptional regulator